MMKINGEQQSVGSLKIERMDQPQLIQEFDDQTEVADAHFLVSIVEF